MVRTFKGRPVLPGTVSGLVVVSKTGFNAYAIFYNSLETDAEKAIGADLGNPQMYGKRLDGKILCVPNTIGSTSAGAVWSRIIHLGVAPLAMLFSEDIDPLAAGGLIVADLWMGKRIFTIDQLGDEFLENVVSGDCVHIQKCGKVIVE